MPGRVLVVDDDADSREALCAVLTTWGFEVDVAADGHHAVESALARAPDIIVTDMSLPDSGGCNVITLLRSRVPAHVRIVVYSGHDQFQDDARAAGANAFVLKPDVEALERILVGSPGPGGRT